MAIIAICTPTSDGGSVQRHWNVEGVESERVYNLLRGLYGEPAVEFFISPEEAQHLVELRDTLETPPLIRT